MLQYSAIAIAGIFALVGFLPLAWQRLRRPLVWLCLLAGTLTVPIAREGMQLGWDWLGPIGGVANSPVGPTVYLLIAAAVGELVKVTAPLAAVTFTPADAATGLAYGAAAGAGFGFMATARVLELALGLVGSPFITPLSTAVAVFGWFFPVLAHIVTTAFLTRAAVRGGFGVSFLVVWVVQSLLGLSQRLPMVRGFPTGLLVTMVITLWMFRYLWSVRSRDEGPAIVSP